MDRHNAFSRNDLKDLRGDTELRKQMKIPKTELGICAPLAIETNGTVFTAMKLRPDKHNPIKKLTTSFAKRVALTAAPFPCQTCECTGHNTGVAYMQCFPCLTLNADGSDDYVSYEYYRLGRKFLPNELRTISELLIKLYDYIVKTFYNNNDNK